MDNFEKHIREQKELFNVHKADKEKLWANISSQLNVPEKKIIPLWKSSIFRVAASIVLLLGIATFVGLNALGIPYSASEDTLIASELQDIDTHYKNLVYQQVQLLQDHPKIASKDKEEFLSFMDELDQEYELLKLEMHKNLDNERVLEAIIGNYKKRIELIENLLRQINDSKQIEEDYGYTL